MQTAPAGLHRGGAVCPQVGAGARARADWLEPAAASTRYKLPVPHPCAPDTLDPQMATDLMRAAPHQRLPPPSAAEWGKAAAARLTAGGTVAVLLSEEPHLAVVGPRLVFHVA